MCVCGGARYVRDWTALILLCVCGEWGEHSRLPRYLVGGGEWVPSRCEEGEV